MTKFQAHALIAASGIATSVCTAIGVTLIHMWTGFNLFSLSTLVVIPAGAGICGFGAASGYYLAAKLLHQRPSKFLFLQMIVVAAFTQMLIYWLEYRTMVIDGVLVSSFVGFWDYLDVTLTHSEMRFGRALQIQGGEVGTFGYWLAVINFIGFLVGGGFVYITLKDQPNCSECGKYLRSALKKEDSFSDVDDLAPYYDNVYTHPVDSDEFVVHVGREFSAGKAQQGTINLTTTIFECPQCLNQSVLEHVQVFNGRDWKDVNQLRRFVKMPDGVDVRRAFNA